jgi:ABC-type branched-subunit amino acid transport system ATPase component
MAHLEVDKLQVGYVAGVDILQNLSMEAKPGIITGIIGPNGAGKSTLLKAIFGFLAPHEGTISFDGSQVIGRTPAEIKMQGISYIPQGANNFPHLPVKENLLLGCWTFRHDKQRIEQMLEETYELFPILRTKQKQKAGLLSGGEAKMLSIAKELMTSPSLALVDEPSAGLSPKITDYVYEFLAKKRDDGLTILLVDQNIKKAIEFSEYLYMLEMGTVKMEGEQQIFTDHIREIIRDSLVGEEE